jgi:hypothetical protein
MKIIITESQYNKLINEGFPPEVETKLGDKATKFIINVFKWCHENAEVKRKFNKNEVVKVNTHPILDLGSKIAKTFSINRWDAVIISFNFYLRYNDGGDYEQFLGEDLTYFGNFKYYGNVSLRQTEYASAKADIYVYGTDPDDVYSKVESEDYYDLVIDYDSVHREDMYYDEDWEIYEVDEVDDVDDIEYI